MRTMIFSVLAVAAAAVAVVGCGGGGGGGAPETPPPVAETPAQLLKCDESLKTEFKPDSNTTVLTVVSYKAGDQLSIPGGASTTTTATADLCFVKLLVGPGSPGTAGAPSTSAGIGIEVWLPSADGWNERIRNQGGGGWAGGQHSVATTMASRGNAGLAGQGYVVGSTDTGHAGGNGAFAMREDGSVNSALWEDFSHRSLKELALKTRALVNGYYGKPQKYAYWEGCSTGGRQGYKIAQEDPELYDGYLNGAPAFNWTQFITSELYPQIVMRRDLGATISAEKLNAVSAAAVGACNTVGGQQLAFISDPSQCRYDPTKDAAMLCSGETGIGGVVGTNATASCVTLAEATAVNKMWYGQTADGTVPDPALDNAGAPIRTTSNHLWWGLLRGTSLSALAGGFVFPIATDMVALELQNPLIAQPSFLNASGNGANGWQNLTYADMAVAHAQGIAMQPFFGRIDTNNADLSRLRASGGKVISYHGMGDTLITAAGSANYFTRVANLQGGYHEVHTFNRLFMVPAMGHCAGIGSVSPSSGPAANTNSVPLPATGQFFNALVDWVENGVAPSRLDIRSADSSVSMPLCPYPQKASYNGSGAATDTANYSCR